MKRLLVLLCLSLPLMAQLPGRWFATTGDVSLSGAGTTATIQQPATNGQQVQIETIVVYCSVACNITQAANGAAATSTAGTIQGILPNLWTAPTATFWTASNVGSGTAQGGIYHLTSAGSVVFCLNQACGNTQSVNLGAGGTNSNYSVTISSITGTANITFYARSY